MLDLWRPIGKYQSAEKYADRPFVTRLRTGDSLSGAQFNRFTNRVVHGLIAIKPGDYIGIMLGKGISFLVASYTMEKIGCVEGSINITMRGLPMLF